jgi:hypothetical protein
VKVYSEQGEYEKVVAEAVSRLGQPCRDGGAEASQWLHCLAVTSLLLERLMSLHQLVGCAIGSQEILDALLLPAVSKKKVLYISHFRDNQTVVEFSVLSFMEELGCSKGFSHP